MSKVDPMDKAAECRRALELSSDPLQRALLPTLCALWIELANARSSFSEAQFAELLEQIGRLHIALLGRSLNVH
jgi:hypothetical protein